MAVGKTTKKKKAKGPAKKKPSKATKPAKPKAVKPVEEETDLPEIALPQVVGVSAMGGPIYGNPVRAMFDIRDLLMYTYHLMGWTNLRIAEHLQCHRNTVLKRLKRMQEQLDSQMDMDKGRKSVLSLLPLAMGSLAHNLVMCNEKTTSDYLKGIGVYVEKREEAPAGDVPDADLARRILSVVETVAGGKAGSKS